MCPRPIKTAQVCVLRKNDFIALITGIPVKTQQIKKHTFNPELNDLRKKNLFEKI